MFLQFNVHTRRVRVVAGFVVAEITPEKLMALGGDIESLTHQAMQNPACEIPVPHNPRVRRVFTAVRQ